MTWQTVTDMLFLAVLTLTAHQFVTDRPVPAHPGRSRAMPPTIHTPVMSNKLQRPHEFGFVTVNEDDEQTVHVFRAVNRINQLGVTLLMEGADEAGGGWGELTQHIARTLDDRDGQVRAKWDGSLLPQPEDWPEGEEYTPHFRAPDGTLMPESDRDKFTDQSTWTSRRRYLWLVRDPEQPIMGSTKTLLAVIKDLVAVSADRPTGES